MSNNPLDAVPDHLGLPRFREWKQAWDTSNTDYGLDDYLFFNGNLELAIALCQYLWPRVYAINGCYLRTPLSEGGHYPSATLTLGEQQQYVRFVHVQ